MDKIQIVYNRGYRVTESGEVISPFKSNPLKTYLSKNGYPNFGVRFDGRTRPVAIHRLQAYQKFGARMFAEGIVVRHLDGNPRNNSRDNIAIGTARDNRMDIDPSIRMASALKATEKIRKYNKKAVKEYYRLNGWTDTMVHFGITSKGTLSYILNT